MKLSGAWLEKTDTSMLELSMIVININLPNNDVYSNVKSTCQMFPNVQRRKGNGYEIMLNNIVLYREGRLLFDAAPHQKGTGH